MERCRNAFNHAKVALVSADVLAHYDVTKSLRLAADASPYGIGAVLSHIEANGEEHPVALVSRTLTRAEQNYSQLEKEALALIFGVRKSYAYIYGRRFTLVTDHKPLVTILGPKQRIPTLAAARLQRWALILSAHQYDIEYRNTRDHVNADALSRLPMDGVVVDYIYCSEEAMYNVSFVADLPVDANEIAKVIHKIQCCRLYLGPHLGTRAKFGRSFGLATCGRPQLKLLLLLSFYDLGLRPIIAAGHRKLRPNLAPMPYWIAK